VSAVFQRDQFLAIIVLSFAWGWCELLCDLLEVVGHSLARQSFDYLSRLSEFSHRVKLEERNALKRNLIEASGISEKGSQEAEVMVNDSIYHIWC